MNIYTDYPIIPLGDVGGEEAPIRQVDIISYDGDKYCKVKILGTSHTEEVKRFYLYNSPRRYDSDVECFEPDIIYDIINNNC